jgi:hypothetical protein
MDIEPADNLCKRINGTSLSEPNKSLSFNMVPLPKETSCQQDEHLKKIKKGKVLILQFISSYSYTHL